jgi:RNA-directed DNA polymerase
VSREAHAPFCEQLRGKFPWLTYLVITGNSKELLENEIKPLVREFLAERGLTLSEEKTKVTHISEGFDFLGQNIRKYRCGKTNEKLLIKPAKKNVKAFLADIRKTIHTLRTAKQETLIKILNPKITGWANYHRHIVAKETFSKIDHSIWRALWNWARRRHPNKNRRWIFSRYFQLIGNRNGVFSCQSVRKDESERQLRLKNAADVPIKRHVTIRGAATPFDPFYEEYFEKRNALKMAENLEGHRKLLHLWKRQKGLCAICTEKITQETGWHLHHLIRRIDGGPDTVSNLCLLHPVCHMQGHSSGFRFVRPVGPENPT